MSGRAEAPGADAARCASMFEEFARTANPRAPLYHRLASGIAREPELAGLLLLAPPRQRQPVLLLACIHFLLLGRAASDTTAAALAAHYPDLAAEPATHDPVPALQAFCAAHAGELAELLGTRATQTNEIGRAALLLPVLGLLAAEVGPLAHVDVGTSAGLNLLLDRYHYTYEPGGEVGPLSTVHLTCATRGPVPTPLGTPRVVERVGLDLAPVDVSDDDAARWLVACVWPDQLDRMDRLRAAVALARTASLDLRTGEAVADTPALVAATGAHPVVTTTWVMSYLSPDERRAFVDALDGCGRRRDLSWVFAESPALVPELPRSDGRTSTTALVLVRWRRGKRKALHLAQCHPHGYWLQWR